MNTPCSPSSAVWQFIRVINPDPLPDPIHKVNNQLLTYAVHAPGIFTTNSIKC